MTSLHILPVPLPLSATHEHAWLIESRHPTSEGVVLYVRCGDCGTRRVDLQTSSAMPPAPVSVELDAR